MPEISGFASVADRVIELAVSLIEMPEQSQLVTRRPIMMATSGKVRE